MKKLVALLPGFLFLSLVLITTGCEKDPQILEKPNIKVEVSDPNPEFGGTSIVTWEVTGDYERVAVSINGVVKYTSPKSPDGGMSIPDITSKQIISVSCWISDNSEPILKTREINPKDEVVVVPNPPTISSVSISPEIFPIGGGICTINISASNVDEIFWLGSWIEFNSPFQISTAWINQDTSFTLVLKGKGGEISQLFSVEVQVPLTGQELIEAMLDVGPWRDIASRSSYNSEGGPWAIRNIDYDAPCMIDDTLDFSLNPNKVTLSDPFPCGGGPPSTFVWDWTLTGNIISGFNDKEIISISWDTLKWKEQASETNWIDGEPVTVTIWIETTFIHPN